MRGEMTDAQLDALVGYICLLQERMRLQHWTVDVGKRYCKRSRLGYTVTTPGRIVARMTFGREFWSSSPEQQRELVTHELLHLLHVNVTGEVRLGKYIRDIGQTTYDALHANVVRHIEVMVDHMASLLAPSLPLPHWPAGLAS